MHKFYKTHFFCKKNAMMHYILMADIIISSEKPAKELISHFKEVILAANSTPIISMWRKEKSRKLKEFKVSRTLLNLLSNE